MSRTRVSILTICIVTFGAITRVDQYFSTRDAHRPAVARSGVSQQPAAPAGAAPAHAARRWKRPLRPRRVHRGATHAAAGARPMRPPNRRPIHEPLINPEHGALMSRQRLRGAQLASARKQPYRTVVYPAYPAYPEYRRTPYAVRRTPGAVQPRTLARATSPRSVPELVSGHPRTPRALPAFHFTPRPMAGAAPYSLARGRLASPSAMPSDRQCAHCGTLHTPLWRRSPLGPKTLVRRPVPAPTPAAPSCTSHHTTPAH